MICLSVVGGGGCVIAHPQFQFGEGAYGNKTIALRQRGFVTEKRLVDVEMFVTAYNQFPFGERVYANNQVCIATA